MKSFLVRLTSGIILVGLLAVGLIWGDYILCGLLALVSLGGIREFYQAMGSHSKELSKARLDIISMVGYAATLALYVSLYFYKSESAIMIVMLCSCLVAMCVYVFTYPQYRPVDFVSCVYGILYVPVMMSTIYLIRLMDNGVYFVWLVFICSWVCDTCAYCVGSLMGRHKLAPVLSPKKSIEGAIGGCVGSMLAAIIFAKIVESFGGVTSIDNSATALGFTAVCAVLGVAGAAFSQVGDLCASAVKRYYGVKDYGQVIPGHGGILDRFDSTIVAAVVVYIILKLVL